jgi:hypothetical protein
MRRITKQPGPRSKENVKEDNEEKRKLNMEALQIKARKGDAEVRDGWAQCAPMVAGCHQMTRKQSSGIASPQTVEMIGPEKKLKELGESYQSICSLRSLPRKIRISLRMRLLFQGCKIFSLCACHIT